MLAEYNYKKGKKKRQPVILASQQLILSHVFLKLIRQQNSSLLRLFIIHGGEALSIKTISINKNKQYTGCFPGRYDKYLECIQTHCLRIFLKDYSFVNFYLKGGDRDRQRSSICMFTPQMPRVAGAGAG